ncbi:hypothetical protein AVEN_198404-1 [Araneus ventricosus]|uniref:Uncharacterized protein n=1 Tax=Araneus ventricosus TaxID=182803 RepID=A0A4Y2KII1_ARAVE|nr:hypothetical protein AVEN_198404-1 [Araneus ventricosus]
MDLTCTRPADMADLQWNQILNLESSSSKAEILPPGHCNNGFLQTSVAHYEKTYQNFCNLKGILFSLNRWNQHTICHLNQDDYKENKFYICDTMH